MNAWAVHAVFAAILVGSLATQRPAADALADNVSLEPAVLRVAGAHGWRLREYRPAIGVVSRSLVFDVSGCSQPVHVSLLLSTFEEVTMMESDSDPGYTRRYFYFDRTWDAPDPWGAFVQGMKYRIAAIFGLTEFAPSHYLLQVETPPHCRAAEILDWRPVWSRDNHAAARADTEAATEN